MIEEVEKKTVANTKSIGDLTFSGETMLFLMDALLICKSSMRKIGI